MSENPFANFDVSAYDGEEIAPGVEVIGSISWNNKLQRWVALARVGESLALIELRVTVPQSK
jgi:hypothetical protein